MLPSLGRWQRLALALSLSLGYLAWHGHTTLAFADGEDEEEGGGDGDGDGGGDKGGDGDGDGETEGEDDKDQPPVTAGGLFTMKSFPVRENSRPLTMTEGITQIRAGLGTDLSAKGAFGSFGLNLEAAYGMKDNFTLIGGLTDAYNFKAYGLYFGFEGSLVYDMLDIRVAANLHRNAIPHFENFCSPATAADPMNPSAPGMCGAGANAALVSLPNGKYEAGGTKFSIDLGFPFRYAIKPEIAIVALQTLISIDFNSVDKDHTILAPALDGNGMPILDGMMNPVLANIPTKNSAKPDLKPSIGIATNPVPPLSVVVFAQLLIPDFDTSAGAFQVPLTARIEFSPSQKFDIGLEFTLLNVKPPEGQSPIDNRFLSMFMQARFGK